MEFSSGDWEWLGDWLKRRGLPGMAIAATNAEGEQAFFGKGWAEMRNRPIDENTLFEIGSIGKTFTAVLASQTLDPQAPVTRYLPWFEVQSAYEPITVEHLLMHTSGLIRGQEMTSDSRYDVWALRETEVGFPPGERHYYSNVGYRTLGYVLEAATGRSYPDLLRALIFDLGLKNTEPEITVEIRDRMAVGYDRLHDDRTPSPADPLYPAPWLETGTADGSPAATAGDLAAFGRFLLAGEAEKLTSGPLVDSGHGWSYGYGLERKGTLVGHGGSMPGFASSMLGDLESGVAVAALMNGPDEHNAAEVVARFALGLCRGEDPEPPGDPEPWPERPLVPELEKHASFYGRYRSYNPWQPGFRFVQWAEGPGVVLGWGEEQPLSQLGENEFRVGEEKWLPERLRFDAFVDGKALRANLSGESYYRSDFA